MFDEKDIPANLPTGAATSPEGGDHVAQPAPTLSMPTVGAGHVPPAPDSTAPAIDMFDAVDGPSTLSSPSSPMDHQAPSPKKGSALKVILIIVAAVILLAAIAWGAFALLGATESEPASSPQGGEVPQRGGGDIQEPTTPTVPIDDPVPTSPQPAPEPDGDGDGLTDAEEARYGTAIHKPDTDNDGLFDREEVMVYRTNPLSADTDGDGFLDGSEVSNGYNPNGPGRLTELPTSKD